MIIDSNEAKLISIARDLDIPFTVERLDTGDIVAGNIVAERKTFADFLQSLKSGRLKDQIKRLSTADEPALVVEMDRVAFFNGIYFPFSAKQKGTVSLLVAKRSGVNPVVINALNTIQERGIRLLLSAGPEMTLRILHSVEERGTVALSRTVSVPSRKRTTREIAFNVLTALPGIGPKTANDLLSRCEGMTLLEILEKIDMLVPTERGKKAKNALLSRI